MSKLTEIKIQNIKQKGRYLDGFGLYLNVGASKNKNWTFQFTINKKKKEMGLGPYPIVSLKEARKKKDELRNLIIRDIDPLVEKRQLKQKIQTIQPKI